MREAIAGGFLIVGHVDSHKNLADICTKPLETAVFEKLTAQYLFRKPKSLLKEKGLMWLRIESKLIKQENPEKSNNYEENWEKLV